MRIYLFHGKDYQFPHPKLYLLLLIVWETPGRKVEYGTQGTCLAYVCKIISDFQKKVFNKNCQLFPDVGDKGVVRKINSLCVHPTYLLLQ